MAQQQVPCWQSMLTNTWSLHEQLHPTPPTVLRTYTPCSTNRFNGSPSAAPAVEALSWPLGLLLLLGPSTCPAAAQALPRTATEPPGAAETPASPLPATADPVIAVLLLKRRAGPRPLPPGGKLANVRRRTGEPDPASAPVAARPAGLAAVLLLPSMREGEPAGLRAAADDSRPPTDCCCCCCWSLSLALSLSPPKSCLCTASMRAARPCLTSCTPWLSSAACTRQPHAQHSRRRHTFKALEGFGHSPSLLVSGYAVERNSTDSLR